MKKKPVVAVVGRPNVGKSTLFNVLAGDMISIVKDTPGVTRDRIYADCTWLDHSFTLIDTGGIEPDTKDIILSQMREQAEIAIATADVSRRQLRLSTRSRHAKPIPSVLHVLELPLKSSLSGKAHSQQGEAVTVHEISSLFPAVAVRFGAFKKHLRKIAHIFF